MPFFLLNIWSLFWGNILSVTFPGFICTCSTAWMIISVSKWLITMVIISPLNYGCGTVGPLPNWPKCMARHKSKGDVTNLTTYPSKSKLHPPTLGHVFSVRHTEVSKSHFFRNEKTGSGVAMLRTLELSLPAGEVAFVQSSPGGIFSRDGQVRTCWGFQNFFSQ